MSKQDLYSEFIARMENSLDAGYYFEASWYAYAVLEDRLRSLLRSSGGEGKNGSNKQIKMMGPKMGELERRSKKDKLLNANFEFDQLDTWKDDRNNLMHAMADASMTMSEVKSASMKLATEGAALVRDYSSACRRLKKHRSKVTPE